MLLNYKVKGFKTFNEEVELSFRANKKIKDKNYVFNYENEEILKSNIIYGPNNTGKSTFIESIKTLKEIILTGMLTKEFDFYFTFNLFENKGIDFEIEFIENSSIFKYFLSIVYQKGITEEKLYVDKKMIFSRSGENEDKDIENLVNVFKQYNNKIIVTTLPSKYKNVTENFSSFFSKILILNDVFYFDKAIEEVLEFNKNDLNKVNNIIKNADISIESLRVDNKFEGNSKNLNLFSEYIMNEKKKIMPSLISDSDGTKMFMLYIAEIIKLSKSGGIIIIDEIDKSLHSLLTKNIISLFNNDKNNNMQLLATTHDLLLLDTKYLFRKDQIWFTYKDKKCAYLYSLNDFKANKDKSIRTKTMESYLKGMFGALPYPDIEDSFYSE